MEAGNQHGFKRRYSTFFNNLWSLIIDSPLLASDSLSAKIAELAPMLLAFCLAFSVQITAMSLQIQRKFPASVAILAVCILLGFSCLLVAKLAEFETQKPARLLHCLALLFLAIAFFVAISIPFPIYFSITAFAIFVASSGLVICSITIPKKDSLPLDQAA